MKKGMNFGNTYLPVGRNADATNFKIRKEETIMSTRKINDIILDFIIILVFVMFIPVAQAENIDMISCGSGNINVIAAGEDLTIMAMEGKGINLDNYGNKTFDNMTYQYGALFKIDKGNWSGSMLMKYMDPSDDFFAVEITQVGMVRDWKFIYGTGKWKGLTGGGKALPITKGKPISPGTSQGCVKITGTYELKK